jgi:hypothetical protein
MDRMLILAVFAVLHLAALAVAALCYGPACAWMTGGGCLSPAVRIPLVIVALGLAELFVLALVWPCHRLTHRFWGRHG